MSRRPPLSLEVIFNLDCEMLRYDCPKEDVMGWLNERALESALKSVPHGMWSVVRTKLIIDEDTNIRRYKVRVEAP